MPNLHETDTEKITIDLKTTDREMKLSQIDVVTDILLYKIKKHAKNIESDEFVIMPNHIHGIIEIKPISDVGADLRVCPSKYAGEHIGSPLHRMVQWFKTMTTNEYIKNVKQNKWLPFYKKLWQRNYYEHIIRNEKSYEKIAEYIINNTLKWEEDKYYA